MQDFAPSVAPRKPHILRYAADGKLVLASPSIQRDDPYCNSTTMPNLGSQPKNALSCANFGWETGKQCVCRDRDRREAVPASPEACFILFPLIALRGPFFKVPSIRKTLADASLSEGSCVGKTGQEHSSADHGDSDLRSRFDAKVYSTKSRIVSEKFCSAHLFIMCQIDATGTSVISHDMLMEAFMCSAAQQRDEKSKTGIQRDPGWRLVSGGRTF